MLNTIKHKYHAVRTAARALQELWQGYKTHVIAVAPLKPAQFKDEELVTPEQYVDFLDFVAYDSVATLGTAIEIVGAALREVGLPLVPEDTLWRLLERQQKQIHEAADAIRLDAAPRAFSAWCK